MRAIRLSCLAAAAAFAALAAVAQPVTEPTTRSDETGLSEAGFEPLPLGAGLRVFIDPATGRFREPTKAERAAIAETSRASLNKSIDGLEVEYRPDGSKFLDLQGRFMHSVRVSVGPDGSVVYNCAAGDEHARATPPAAAPAPADR